MTIQDAVKAIDKIQPGFQYSIEGVSPEEIEKLEKTLGKLPAQYVDFLTTMGKNAGRIVFRAPHGTNDLTLTSELISTQTRQILRLKKKKSEKGKTQTYLCIGLFRGTCQDCENCYFKEEDGKSMVGEAEGSSLAWLASTISGYVLKEAIYSFKVSPLKEKTTIHADLKKIPEFKKALVYQEGFSKMKLPDDADDECYLRNEDIIIIPKMAEPKATVMSIALGSHSSNTIKKFKSMLG
jgi:hypothetical protein